MVETEKQVVIWKTYPECPFIEANQFGEIRTKDRYIKTKNGPRFVKGRILKQYDIGHGYMQVQFSANGNPVHLYVHRIVATCFLPNPNNYPEVNHIDNDPTNNAVSNLEWCSHEYNMSYKENFGTLPAQVQGRPVIAINPETSEILCFESQREASRQLGVNLGSLSHILKGKRNQTHGYYFYYVDSTAVEKTRTKFGDKVADKVERLMSNI